MKNNIKLLLICLGVLTSNVASAKNAFDDVSTVAVQSGLSVEQVAVIKKYIHDARDLGHSDLQIAQEFEQAVAQMQEKNGTLELSLNYNPKVVKYVVVGLSATAAVGIAWLLYYHFAKKSVISASQVTNQPAPQNVPQNVSGVQPTVAQPASSDAPNAPEVLGENQEASTVPAGNSAVNPAPATEPVAPALADVPVQPAAPAVNPAVPNAAVVLEENPVVAPVPAVEPVVNVIPHVEPQAVQPNEPVIAAPEPEVVLENPVLEAPELAPVPEVNPVELNPAVVLEENLEVIAPAPVVEPVVVNPDINLVVPEPVAPVTPRSPRRSLVRDRLAIPPTTNFSVPPSANRRVASETRTGSGGRTGSGRVSKPVKRLGHNS